MENLYLDPLSLEAEIPRLTAQARMLYAAQAPFLERNLKNYPDSGQILDAGAGNGILTSMIAKNHFKSSKVTAVDSSEKFIQLTKITHPKFDWHLADIVDLPFEDNTFDFSIASYVIIHLRNPMKAMQELKRVTKPGGLIYIVNPADYCFRGSDVFLNLVKKHAEIYEGDRYVMKTLQEESEKIGLELLDSEALVVDNKGSDEAPSIGFPHSSLGKMTAWSMLIYMGQRDEIADLFEKCQQEYMLDRVTFEAEIHLHLYKK